MTKSMDLLMWWLNLEPSEMFTAESFHPMIHELARKVTDEHGVTIRDFDKKDLQNEITRFIEVYNSAWEKNWGFVPITEQEVRAQAKDLKPVMDERWGFIAERDGEILGAALTLPDVNQVLAKMNGSLLPFGWAKFLRATFSPEGVNTKAAAIDRVRVFALGVKPEHQHLGIAAAFYDRCLEVGKRPEPAPRRDGLDPRGQQADEPRHGGDGRQGGQEVPALRAGALGACGFSGRARG